MKTIETPTSVNGMEGCHTSEQGIVRAPNGRIIATGWPVVPQQLWPSAYEEVSHVIAEQVDHERSLRRMAQKNERGAYAQIGEERVFNLKGTQLVPVVEEEILRRLHDRNDDQPVAICDIGGGDGTLLRAATFDLRRKPETADRITTTLTTLVHHATEYQGIDEIKTMAIELPPTEFFGKFDIIIAQNSVYFWTNFPELATLNMWKMLKEGGVVLATVPSVSRTLNDMAFDTKNYLRNSPLFEYQHIMLHDMNYDAPPDPSVMMRKVSTADAVVSPQPALG